jgi:hypothetical protein
MVFPDTTLSVLIDGNPIMSTFAEPGRTSTHGMVAVGAHGIKFGSTVSCIGAACP